MNKMIPITLIFLMVLSIQTYALDNGCSNQTSWHYVLNSVETFETPVTDWTAIAPDTEYSFNYSEDYAYEGDYSLKFYGLDSTIFGKDGNMSDGAFSIMFYPSVQSCIEPPNSQDVFYIGIGNSTDYNGVIHITDSGQISYWDNGEWTATTNAIALNKWYNITIYTNADYIIELKVSNTTWSYDQTIINSSNSMTNKYIDLQMKDCACDTTYKRIGYYDLLTTYRNETYNHTVCVNPYTDTYCLNDITLVINRTLMTSDGVSWYATFPPCVFGCDNVTLSCNPPQYEANVFIMAIIIIIIIGCILVYRFARSRR